MGSGFHEWGRLLNYFSYLLRLLELPFLLCQIMNFRSSSPFIMKWPGRPSLMCLVITSSNKIYQWMKNVPPGRLICPGPGCQAPAQVTSPHTWYLSFNWCDKTSVGGDHSNCYLWSRWFASNIKCSKRCSKWWYLSLNWIIYCLNENKDTDSFSKPNRSIFVDRCYYQKQIQTKIKYSLRWCKFRHIVGIIVRSTSTTILIEILQKLWQNLH